MSHAKTAKPIKMQSARQTRVGHRNDRISLGSTLAPPGE